MVMGDTDRTPNEGYTAGSMTINISGSLLRQAASKKARALEMAADELDATTEELTMREGVIYVIHDPERRITFADLMGGKEFHRESPEHDPIKTSAGISHCRAGNSKARFAC